MRRDTMTAALDARASAERVLLTERAVGEPVLALFAYSHLKPGAAAPRLPPRVSFGPRTGEEVLAVGQASTARLGDDTSRGADPARYKGPQSLNGRRSNLDDCIAAVEAKSPWLGALTGLPSPGGRPSPEGGHPGQLSLDGLESD